MEMKLFSNQEQFREAARRAGQAVPTDADNAIIPEVMQKIIAVVQEYGRDRDLSFPGAMSAIVSAAGILIGNTYDDAGTRRAVCQSAAKSALAFADAVAQYRANSSDGEAAGAAKGEA